MSEDDTFKKIADKLNSVSSCFCLAKWTTVSLHLESGITHSCHHPRAHAISLDEIKNNPAAIHNTSHKIEQRRKMINGERPAECRYCWDIEDLNPSNISDRVFKSARQGSITRFDEVLNDPYSKIFKPSYVEVSFSNACQFKCSYCSANFSSSWEDELEKFGPYLTGSGQKTVNIIKDAESNPYIKAFWDWWPELSQSINTLRITGGEPLLAPSTFEVFERLEKEPLPHLNLAINSNLSAPDVLINKFVDSASQLLSTGAVAALSVYTSIDGYGDAAEYMRYGLNNNIFWSNVEKVLSANPQLSIGIMSTFNALSTTSYIPLLQKIMQLNLKYRNDKRLYPIDLDTICLKHPYYQSIQVLTADYVDRLNQILDFLEQNRWPSLQDRAGFYDHHIMKIKRLVDWMKADVDENLIKEARRNFYIFFSEHDRRRQTNFLKTFPEMADFWNLCANLNSN